MTGVAVDTLETFGHAVLGMAEALTKAFLVAGDVEEDEALARRLVPAAESEVEPAVDAMVCWMTEKPGFVEDERVIVGVTVGVIVGVIDGIVKGIVDGEGVDGMAGTIDDADALAAAAGAE